MGDTDPTRAGISTVRASDGGELLRVSAAPDGMSDQPGDYSPDGSQLVFKRTDDEEAGPLFFVDASGSGEPQAIGELAFEDAGRFSPDGASLLTSAGGTIMVISLDGSVIGTIGEAEYVLFGAVWSPDGEWIAYSRSTSAFAAELIISRPDGSDRWQVTDTPANEIDVEWGSGS